MYYPKSQIKTNLYTNGNEYTVLSTGDIYQGFYYKISTGEYFTGRTPDDRPNLEIVPIIQPTEVTLNNVSFRYNIDVAFDYEIIKRKLALNTYDFVLIDLDKTHLEMDDNLVYFTRNFSTKNRDTTIFGFSTENSDEIKKDVRICAHINHVMNFPFTAEDIELMITLARWKIDATFHKYTLQNSITPDRS